MSNVLLVAGARPNFMKIAPIIRALRDDGRLSWQLVHTGQHYDRNMSGVFFEELGIPSPDISLNCGGGSHAGQTARVMEAFETQLSSDPADLVLVVGDVNSTMACTIVAKKANIPVAHVEAGLRSGDMTMPEEVNRIVTDAVSDWFFVTEPSGVENLLREGHPPDRIKHVGHVMVDNLLYQAERLSQASSDSLATDPLKRRLERYAVVTLHRPSNVDHPDTLRRIIDALRTVARQVPIVFAVHPRTRATMDKHGIEVGGGIFLIDPQPYMGFLNLWKDAALVLTDSGGLQEETTALGVPCVTIRDNTERPITIVEGTNVLAGRDPERIVALASQALSRGHQPGRRPALWDGKASERIVSALVTRHFGR